VVFIPYPNEHSARLKDPGQFDKFARKNDAGGTGVDFIFGIKDGKSEVQAIRFDKSKFTPAEAKDWLKRNKKKAIEFEPASGDKNHSVTAASVQVPSSGTEKKEFTVSIDKDTSIVSDVHPSNVEEEDPVLGLNPVTREMWCEAFAAGKDPNYGETWTPEDLQKIVKKYNETVKLDPRPVTLGHPTKENSSLPAVGWIEKATSKGGKILLKLTQLNKNFVKWLEEGAYKTRSIGFEEGPDGYQIGHIAFLGASTPAIKGLLPLDFTLNTEYKVYTFSKEQIVPETIDVNAMENEIINLKKENGWFKNLMNKFKMEVSKEFSYDDQIDREDGPEKDSEEGGEVAEYKKAVDREDKLAPAEDPQITVGKEAQAEVKNKANEAEKENMELKDMVEQLTKRIKDLEDSITKKDFTATVEAKKISNRQFCDQLVRDGKLRPADLESEVENLNNREHIDSCLEFSERGPTTFCDDYRKELTSRPKIVEFTDIATPAAVAEDALVSLPADANSVDKYIAKFVEDRMKLNPNISYVDAMNEAYMSIKDPAKQAAWKNAYCGLK